MREESCSAAPCPGREPRPDERSTSCSPMCRGRRRARLIALLLDRQPDGAAPAARDAVRKRFGESSMPAFSAASAALGPLTPAQRTLALDKLLPAHARTAGTGAAAAWRRSSSISRRPTSSTDVFEYALSREASVFIADLLEPRDPHGKANLGDRARRAAHCVSPWSRSTEPARRGRGVRSGNESRRAGNGPRFAPLHELDGDARSGAHDSKRYG